MNILLAFSGVPYGNIASIITGVKNAVVEVIEADIFDLFFVVAEVAERMNFIAVAFGGNVPER